MIMVDEQWHDVRDLDDVSKLIREEFNYDLADKMDEIVNDLAIDYASDIEDLKDELGRIDEENEELDSKNDDLLEEIENLRDEI